MWDSKEGVSGVSGGGVAASPRPGVGWGGRPDSGFPGGTLGSRVGPGTRVYTDPELTSGPASTLRTEPGTGRGPTAKGAGGSRVPPISANAPSLVSRES